MTGPAVQLRAFQAEDARPQLGFLPEQPSIGVTAMVDGRIAGYGGLHHFENRHWVFFHLNDEGLRRPFFLHRIVKRGLLSARAVGITSLLALCDEATPRAREWLSALGFRQMTEAEKDQGIRELEATSKSSAWISVTEGPEAAR